ncbi:hypothetical protein FRC17_011224 [Serendipita sp. 399]|nr:hypothetical protein FRC17_011224 [Serendipita sp. 399]
MRAFHLFRRCYATKPPGAPSKQAAKSLGKTKPKPKPSADVSAQQRIDILPQGAGMARRASTPIAVRIRRIKSNRDQVKLGLTASEEDTYGRLTNTTHKHDLENPTIWARDMYERRSRIRGLKQADPEDQSAGIINIGEGMGYGNGRVHIVGKRIYLPNFVIQFIRNRTPIGKPYNPYEATFRIPKNLTKNDLRSYLYFVYGVKTTYIRTDNYIGRIITRGHSRTRVRARNGSYKRAVVGLVDPFYPPEMLEDMEKRSRDSFKKKLEDGFHLEQRRQMREEERLLTLKPRTPLGDKRRRYVDGLATSRAKIMKKVLEKRKEREKMIQSKVEELLKNGPIKLRV